MNIQRLDRPSRDGSHKDPIKGKYTGTYSGDASSLKRTSDGLHLIVIDRGSHVGPHSSRHYLVNASSPTRDYVSNLYGDEFDDRVHRYRIIPRQDELGTFDVVVLYALTRSRGRRVADGV